MYRSYPGGREDRTIPVLPDFNRTRDAAIATKLKMHTCDRRGDTDGTRSRRDRSAAPPAHTRSHPCNCRAGREVRGPRLQVQVAQRSTVYAAGRIIRGKCSATRQATPPFFGVHVLMSLISRTHYNTFSSHASYTQWGGPLWCTEHAYPCSPQHGRGAAITGSCTARLYSISSSASPPPPPLALIALRLLRPGRPPP
jgi:hypothetical protein